MKRWEQREECYTCSEGSRMQEVQQTVVAYEINLLEIGTAESAVPTWKTSFHRVCKIRYEVLCLVSEVCAASYGNFELYFGPSVLCFK